MNTFKYKNDYSFSYTTYGDENGYPLLVQHGLIASIRDFGLFERLIHSGIRLICIARPGYGDSAPYIMKNILEWGDIVAKVIEKLKLSYFDVLGISSGAPYGYSIGYKFPDKVNNIFIFSGVPALYHEEVATAWPYEIKKNARLSELQALAYHIFFSEMSEEALLFNDVRDSKNHNCFGIALDLKIRCEDWGFVLPELKSKVYMEHSLRDDQIPYKTAKITSELLNHCQLITREADGHFSREMLDSFIETTILPIIKKHTNSLPF